MELNIGRFFKPLALAIICFISVFYLTKSLGVALLISLVPMLLGWLGVMESFAYSIATIVFLAAVGWAVVPAGIKSVLSEKADEATLEIKQQMSKP
ncbi:hypothetical protein [Methylobacterium sp. E-045]|uniref:hypothetical protein n=1 Tax=Methylobacterium sp. E-045 TaxID=2836575 RepID=UPI001FB9ED90|nr:hypothetical protein [Methylobacterium sp. E-045]